MTEIFVSDSCGNSPRQGWLRDFNVAFIEGDVEKTLGFVAEEIVWELVGEATIRGRQGMGDWLRSMEGKKAKRVELNKFITHGRAAAVNGTYEMESGSKFAFCDVYEFTSTASDSPIRHYSSYVIRL